MYRFYFTRIDFFFFLEPFEIFDKVFKIRSYEVCETLYTKFSAKKPTTQRIWEYKTKIKYQPNSKKLFNLSPLLFVAPTIFPRNRSGPSIYTALVHITILKQLYRKRIKRIKSYFINHQDDGNIEICSENFYTSFGLLSFRIIRAQLPIDMRNPSIINKYFCKVFRQDTDHRSPYCHYNDLYIIIILI